MARIPSASAHRKVLDAAMELVAERGVDGTSMDAIAERSGVSKATIYKHWADKDDLLLEMMASLNGLQDRPSFDSGDTRADLTAVLAYRPTGNAEIRERIMPHFVAYSARNTAFGDTWRKLAMDPPRRELASIMQLGIERGELDPDMNLDFALAVLLGPMIYWHVFLRNRGSTDPGLLAEGVVDAFWRAFAVKSATQMHREGARRVRRRRRERISQK